ncbi:hypothetical protein CEXT_76081 [Caerostris extrusa]|uniref:Uncharacterized protein n=1 Tax=Caerostris extrusa TaxID=172846 RepID=A0AAV4WBJ6_CAEEX|nr:hypothetical protein CEXT_76081 [Caerostris extrusa]
MPLKRRVAEMLISRCCLAQTGSKHSYSRRIAVRFESPIKTDSSPEQKRSKVIYPPCLVGNENRSACVIVIMSARPRLGASESPNSAARVRRFMRLWSLHEEFIFMIKGAKGAHCQKPLPQYTVQTKGVCTNNNVEDS